MSSQIECLTIYFYSRLLIIRQWKSWVRMDEVMGTYGQPDNLTNRSFNQSIDNQSTSQPINLTNQPI